MSNLMDNLPENLQDKIMEMKKEIEKSEYAKKFGDYINGRKEHNERMDEINLKYKNITLPFGKHKGMTVYSVATYKDRYHGYPGKEYLKWVSKNVNIKDKVLKECIEFYKKYYYFHTDGYD